MRVLFTILSSVFVCIFFSNCSNSYVAVTKGNPEAWIKKQSSKMILPTQKTKAKFEAETIVVISGIKQRISKAENRKVEDVLKKNVNKLEYVVKGIRRISPTLLDSLESNGVIDCVDTYIEKKKYLHLKIEADKLFSKGEYVEAIEAIVSHKSENPTAILHEDKLINRILKIHADTIVKHSGEVEPYNLAVSVKSFMMLTPIVTLSKYKYDVYNLDYESFYSDKRQQAFKQLLKYPENQLKKGSVDMAYSNKLYDIAEDIAANSEEVNLVREHRIKITEMCKDMLLQQIETAISNYKFDDACELEKKIISECHPNYTSRCKAEETKYRIRLAEEYYSNDETLEKAEKQIDLALEIEPQNTEALSLKRDITIKLAEHYKRKGREASDMGKFDLALKLFNQALAYTPKHPEYENDLREIRDQIGIVKLGQAEDFRVNKQYKQAYYRAKEAIDYMKDDTEAINFMENVRECATTNVGFALVISNGVHVFGSGSIEANRVIGLIRTKAENKSGELVDLLLLESPFFSSRSDAIYAAKKKGIDELLLFEINSYQWRDDSYSSYDNYATIYTPYYKEVFVKDGCGGLLLPLRDCWHSIFVRAECEAVKYTKIIDDLSVKVGVSKQWLNPTTRESYGRASNVTLSNSFKYEKWYYPGTNKNGAPAYLDLNKYAGENCRNTESLDMSYFKKPRKRVPSYEELASDKIIEYLNQ